jgi:hypothetical protein
MLQPFSLYLADELIFLVKGTMFKGDDALGWPRFTLSQCDDFCLNMNGIAGEKWLGEGGFVNG